jgi:hypothetical protein
MQMLCSYNWDVDYDKEENSCKEESHKEKSDKDKKQQD